MTKLVWNESLNLGIEAIDHQHRQLAEYINQLFAAYASGQQRKKLGKMIDELVEYVNYHFGFEESLQEKAGYPFLEAHKKMHVLYGNRLSEFQSRFEKGEDVFKDTDKLLNNWLFDHLKHDDADYVDSANKYLLLHPGAGTEKNGLMTRLFR